MRSHHPHGQRGCRRCSTAIGTMRSTSLHLNADEQIYMRYGGRDSAVARHLQLASTAWNSRSKQGLELHQHYLPASFEDRAAPQAAVPARDSAAGRAHLRPRPVRRVPPDRRFPEYAARAGRHARQADPPIPLARYQDASASTSMCRRDWWSKRRRARCRPPA